MKRKPKLRWMEATQASQQNVWVIWRRSNKMNGLKDSDDNLLTYEPASKIVIRRGCKKYASREEKQDRILLNDRQKRYSVFETMMMRQALKRTTVQIRISFWSRARDINT